MKTKKKIVPVKDLREMISQSGMTCIEAASHALRALEPNLNCVDEDMENLLKELIGCMVERSDHSIKFKVEEERDDGQLSWHVILRENNSLIAYIDYFPFKMDHAESNANEDAATLNQFILDFYGIKKHSEKLRSSWTKNEVRAELRRVKVAISEKKSELKKLTSLMNKLSKLLELK